MSAGWDNFLLVVMWLVLGPVMLWSIIDPRGMWRSTSSWAYRDPDANEPSDAGYLAQRVTVVTFLIMLVIATVLNVLNE